MALLDLTFTTIKYICTRVKTDYNNINFAKLNIGQHITFDDSGWDYWIYDTYEELCQAWPDYLSEELEEHKIPPDSEW